MEIEIGKVMFLPIPFTTDHPQLSANILRVYAETARYILEIGSGNSTHVLHEAVKQKDGKVWTIDVKNTASDSFTLQYLPGDSLLVPWQMPVDLLYLDGCHEPHHVWHELLKFAPWVNPGGWILIDDVRNEAYPRLEHVLNQFCKCYGLTWAYCAPLPAGIAAIAITYRVEEIPTRSVHSSTDFLSETLQSPHTCTFQEATLIRA